MSKTDYCPESQFVIFPANFMHQPPLIAYSREDCIFKCNHLLRAALGVGLIIDGELNLFTYDGADLVCKSTLGYSYTSARMMVMAGFKVRRRVWPDAVYVAYSEMARGIYQVFPDGCEVQFHAEKSDYDCLDWETVAYGE